MIISGFFTIDDITNVHIKQFSSASGVLEAYVTEAEGQYYDIALQLGVDPNDIYGPIPIVATRYLNAYISYRFAEDSIGSNNVEISENDMYVRMYDQFIVNAATYRKQLTPELIMGTSNNSRSARSISTGKLYRTK